MRFSRGTPGERTFRRNRFSPAVFPSLFFTRHNFSPKSRKFFLCLFLALIVSFTGIGISQATKNRLQTQDPYVVFNRKYYPIPSAEGFIEKGIASWYGGDFHGLKTSNGEVYNMYEMTAAHKTLPMDTLLLVKNLDNGKKIVVRVNDRGPFVRGRIVDLSYKAAKTLGMVIGGIARVQIVALAESDDAGMTLPARDLSTGEYYVQIGTFAQKFNALKLQKRFAEAGHTTVIDKYERSRPVLYRVWIYAGKTLQDAKESEQALLNHGYADSFIVAR